MTMSANDVISYLTSTGALTDPSATNDAAATQVNTAQTASAQDNANSSWGKPIPELMGLTRTLALPLWTGNAQKSIDADGNETDTIDFAVMIGKRSPGSQGAVLNKVLWDSLIVYDIDDASKLTLLGQTLDYAFYDGSQKTVDPTIDKYNQTFDPPVPTPAFTGRMYIVFKNVLTRVVDAATTVTAFSKLPQVVVEINQTGDGGATGGIYKPFDNVPPSKDDLRAGFATWIAKQGKLYVINGKTMTTWSTETNSYLGETTLADPWDGTDDLGLYWGPRGIVPYVITDAGVLIQWARDGGHGRRRVWDLKTGAHLLMDDSKDFNGDQADAYAMLDLGGGWIMPSTQSQSLAHYDGSSVKLWKANIGYAGYGCGSPDALTNFKAASTFQGARIAYYTNANSSQLWRMVITDGNTQKDTAVGNITYDGGSKQVKKPTYAKCVYDLNVLFPGARAGISGIFCDDNDPRYVYILTSDGSGDGTHIRRLGTFFYFNPQNGQKPPAKPDAAYADFDVHIEVANSVAKGNPPANGASGIYADKRFGKMAFASPIGFDLIVFNFRTLSSSVFKGGDLYDAQGKNLTHGAHFSYQNPTYYDPLTNSVMTYSANLNVPGVGRVTPKALGGGGDKFSLAELFTTNAIMAGYEPGQIECIGMDDVVDGQQLNQTVEFSDLMAQYCATFRVDMTETGTGGLKFVRRLHVTTPDATIQSSDMIPADSSNPANIIDIDRVSTNEVPTVLQLSFIEKDFDFHVGSTMVRRTQYPVKTTAVKSTLSLSVPIVMSSTDAAYYAGTALYDMWAGKTTFTVTLPPRFMFAEPGDMYSVVRPSGRVDLCKVTEVNIQPDLTVQLTLSSASRLKPQPLTQNADVPTQVPVKPSQVGVSYGTMTSPSLKGQYTTIIDNIALGGPSSSSGYAPYVASSSPADVYTSTSGGKPIKQTTTAGTQTFGTVVYPLPANDYPFETDTSGRLRVRMGNGQAPPASVTEEQFRAGVNNVCVGTTGRWELVYFRDVTANADGTFTLSRLLRGRLQSDNVIGTGRPGDIVVFGALASTAITVAAQAGAPVDVYGMPPGTAAARQGGVFGTVAASAPLVEPLAPTALAAARSEGDIVLSWHRRDRQELDGANFWNEPALSDAPEKYTVTISIPTGTRITTVTAPTFTYTAAMQTEDKFSGNVLPVEVYQVGTKVPQGRVAKANLNVV